MPLRTSCEVSSLAAWTRLGENQVHYGMYIHMYVYSPPNSFPDFSDNRPYRYIRVHVILYMHKSLLTILVGAQDHS